MEERGSWLKRVFERLSTSKLAYDMVNLHLTDEEQQALDTLSNFEDQYEKTHQGESMPYVMSGVN